MTLEVERAHRPPDAPGNLQAWARDVRYCAAAARRGGTVAVAHTATDQAETVLYRLAASPGRRALLGMAGALGPARAAAAGRHPRRDRPLVREHGLAWREDASNADQAFARARVARRLVPALRAVDGRAEANIVRTAALLRDEAEVLDVVVDTALAGRDRIALARLEALPTALGRLVVRRLAEAATGRLCGRAGARLPELLRLRAGALDVGDGARAVVEDGVLRFERTPPLPAPG